MSDDIEIKGGDERPGPRFALLRIFVAFFCLGLIPATDAIVNRWFVSQYSPALSFSNGPEQVFGVDAMRSIGAGIEVLLFAGAVLFVYPVIKHQVLRLKRKSNQSPASSEEQEVEA